MVSVEVDYITAKTCLIDGALQLNRLRRNPMSLECHLRFYDIIHFSPRPWWFLYNAGFEWCRLPAIRWGALNSAGMCKPNKAALFRSPALLKMLPIPALLGEKMAPNTESQTNTTLPITWSVSDRKPCERSGILPPWHLRTEYPDCRRGGKRASKVVKCNDI